MVNDCHFNFDKIDLINWLIAVKLVKFNDLNVNLVYNWTKKKLKKFKGAKGAVYKITSSSSTTTAAALPACRVYR